MEDDTIPFSTEHLPLRTLFGYYEALPEYLAAATLQHVPEEEPDTPDTLRLRSNCEIQRYGVGPWEDESPTCIDTAIKRPPAPPDASS